MRRSRQSVAGFPIGNGPPFLPFARRAGVARCRRRRRSGRFSRGAARMPDLLDLRALKHIYRRMACAICAKAKRSNLPSCFSVGGRTRVDRLLVANREWAPRLRSMHDESAGYDGGKSIAAALRMALRISDATRGAAPRHRQTASRNSPAISASFRCGANISISRYAYARRNAPLRSPTRVVLASNRCCVSSATSPVSRCGS